MSESEPSGKKVVGLFGDAVIQPGQTYPALITYLEEALEKARSGEMVGCAIVEYLKDDTTYWTAVGHIGHRQTIGTLEILKAWFVKKDMG